MEQTVVDMQNLLTRESLAMSDAQEAARMAQNSNALRAAFEQWIAEHRDSFPPVVVHITDGESQEGDPRPYADPLRELATEDGEEAVVLGTVSVAYAGDRK